MTDPTKNGILSIIHDYPIKSGGIVVSLMQGRLGSVQPIEGADQIGNSGVVGTVDF